MRIVEIFCVPLHLSNILQSVEMLSLILIRQGNTIFAAYKAGQIYKIPSSAPKSTKFLMDKCSDADFRIFGGDIQEWLTIEASMYGFMIITHFILMVKSRFTTVGVDNSH
jgi:hypothetical protein